MSYIKDLRGNNTIKYSNKNQLDLCISEWYSSNEVKNTTDEKTKKNIVKREYTIRVFGNTKDGKSVSCNIYGYTPHYYIKLPDEIGNNKAIISQIVEEVYAKMNYKLKDGFIKYNVVSREDFYYFSNKKKYKFLQLIFNNISSLNATVSLFKKEKFYCKKYSFAHSIYESNIPPFLRFIHAKDILPANWITIKPLKYKVNLDDNKKSTCQIDIDVNWKFVEKKESNELVPFKILSYDLECGSSSGDFPLAKKNYSKLSREIVDIVLKTKNISNMDNFINSLIKSAFDLEINKTQDDISYVFTKKNYKPTKNLIDYASKSILKIFETKENYGILVEDIINNALLGPSSGNNITNSNIHSLLCDAFSENYDDNDFITKIYTKTNKKPTIKGLNYIADLTKKALTKCWLRYTKIQKNNTTLVYKIFSHYKNNKTYFNYNYFNDKFSDSQDIVNSIILSLDTLYIQLLGLYKKYLPEIDGSRDTTVKRINNIFKIKTKTINEDNSDDEDSDDSEYDEDYFPSIEGDPIIQIGNVIQHYGDKEPYLKHIMTLKSCDPIPGAVVESFETEEDMLIAWAEFINKLDPDIITGYNIFGFDFPYLWHRAEELGIIDEFKYLGRIKNKPSNLEIKKLASSALGDNTLQYIVMDGRIQIDLLKVIQRDHNLVTYKLDYVAENFINDKIKDVIDNKLIVDGINTLQLNNFITLKYYNPLNNKYADKKFKVISIDKQNNTIVLDTIIDKNIIFPEKESKATWQLAKDDVSPKDIFRFQDEGPDKRAIIANYCIQDCALCHIIMNKLNIITNNIGMANVCSVPLSYIFLRGQGIKIFSLVSKECRKVKTLIPVIKYDKEEIKLKVPDEYHFVPAEDPDSICEDNGGYEGAIVLKPNPGIYLDTPVSVLDYSSLYPSSMISENLSHDSYVVDEQYLGDEGAKRLKELGYGVVDISYDVYKWVNPKIKSKGKVKTGEKKVCRFAQPDDNTKSIIPRILRELLKARKDTRNKIPNEPDEFQRNVLDGQQLAYKITANSLYGQIGASTSPICLIDIAASTTATGRNLLYLAQEKVLEKFDGAEIVYGDTDSIFVNFNPKDKDGNPILNKEGLQASINLGIEAEKYIQQFLKQPHKLEYEKTFWPFILNSKKRYVGNKYELDINKYKRTEMGLATKRRDYAPIVKYVMNGALEIIMNDKNLESAIKFCRNSCQELLDKKFPMDMLIITKSLRANYKNPDQIAHKVLAERMGKRDPGNKPKSNDRIPYVYIETNTGRNANVLQGDRIENPQYIIENNIKIDYKYYITNQIMKPIGQILALNVEKIKGYNKPDKYYNNLFEKLKTERGDKKAYNKVRDLRYLDAADLVFGDIIRIADNKKNKVREITSYFKCIKS